MEKDETGCGCLGLSIIIAVGCIGAIAVNGASTAVIIAMLIALFVGIPLSIKIISSEKEQKRTQKEYDEWVKKTQQNFIPQPATTGTQKSVTTCEDKRRYIFFDTETTGLPRDYDAPASDTRNWPRLVQLSWILEDETRRKISEGDYIIRPDGFTIPYDVIRIHGITQERAEREGIPLSTAIEKFMKDFNKASMAVGHNIDFDKKIVGAELIRLGMEDTMNSKKSYCTMLHGTDICKLPGPYGYKWPKLQELHRALFGCKFNDAHNSASDVAATEKCFWKMKNM